MADLIIGSSNIISTDSGTPTVQSDVTGGLGLTSNIDSSTTNGPTSGTAVTKSNTLPIFACRAWVNFDGNSVDGSNNCAVRGSGNVEKVVRTATGQYEIYFATHLPDANYCVIGIAGTNENVTYTRNLCQMFNHAEYTKVFAVASGGSLSSDTEHITVAVFR